MDERRRHPEPQARALAEAESIALFFPDVRPQGVRIETVEHLPDFESRRIVDSWTARCPERWAVLVGAAQDVELAERALVAGAVRAAIGDRKPCDPAGLAALEAARLVVHPGNALAAVIPPQAVWDYDVAVDAAEAAAGGEREPAIASIGFGCFERCRPRLRERITWVERQLPFPPFPRVSAVLREGCDLFSTRRGFDAELACAVLEGYVRLLERGFPIGYITSPN